MSKEWESLALAAVLAFSSADVDAKEDGLRFSYKYENKIEYTQDGKAGENVARLSVSMSDADSS